MKQLEYFGCHGNDDDQVAVYCDIKRAGKVVVHIPFNLLQGSVSFNAKDAQLWEGNGIEPLEFYASDPRISWRAAFDDGSEYSHTGIASAAQRESK